MRRHLSPTLPCDAELRRDLIRYAGRELALRRAAVGEDVPAARHVRDGDLPDELRSDPTCGCCAGTHEACWSAAQLICTREIR